MWFLMHSKDVPLWKTLCRNPPNEHHSHSPSKLARPYANMIPLDTSMGLVCPSMSPDGHMVIARSAHFRASRLGARARQNSKNILVRPLIGPLNERGSSPGVQNWSQIQKLPTRSQLTNQEVRRLRYVGACQCRFYLKLAVT